MNVTAKSTKARLLGILLMLCMVASLLPTQTLTAFAAPTYIDKVEIGGVTPPAAGQSCFVNKNLVTVTTSPDANAAVIEDIYWYDETNAIDLDPTSTFTDGNTYSISVELKPASGYAFKFDTSSPEPHKPYLGKAIINGVDAKSAEEFENGKPNLFVTGESITLAAGGPPTPTEFKITLDPDGGVCGTEFLMTENGKLKSPLPKATKKGHIHYGWETNNAGHTSLVTEDTVFTADTTIYATWQKAIKFEFGIPYEIIVEQKGEKEPGEETFVLEIFDPAEPFDYTIDNDSDQTVAVGAGTFPGNLVLKTDNSQIYNISKGFKIRQKTKTAEGWTYSKESWRVVPEIQLLMPDGVLQGVDVEFGFYPLDENGDPLSNIPSEAITFTNVYSASNETVNPEPPANPTTPESPANNNKAGTNTTNPTVSTDKTNGNSPKTSDNNSIALLLGLILISSFGICATYSFGKEKSEEK